MRAHTYAVEELQEPPGVVERVIHVPEHDVFDQNMAAVMGAVVLGRKVLLQDRHQLLKWVSPVHRDDPVPDLDSSRKTCEFFSIRPPSISKWSPL